MSDSRLQAALRERPILITGMGAWTSGGRNVSELWQSLLTGQGLGTWLPIPGGTGNGRMPVCAASTPQLSQPALRRLRRMDRSVAFAAAAAGEAWLQAGLDRTSVASDRIAVIVGSSRGPVHAGADALEQLRSGRVFPSTAAHATLASLSGTLAAMCNASGPCFVVSSACASSATALATAAQLILSGAADIAIVGGAEAPLHPSVIAQLDAAGVLASHSDPALACRPFDRERNGTVLGEGAAFLVLETEDSAKKGNARSYACFAGWGIATEPGERAGVSDDSHGLTAAMRQALRLANLEPAQIDYLNPHGTGTVLNDLQEALAIRSVFGGKAQPPISATKPVTGHCMGAGSALEAIIGVLAMNEGIIPPTVNCDSPDPECGLQLVRGNPLARKIEAVMTNSSGFWGNHASLVFTRTPSRFPGRMA